MARKKDKALIWVAIGAALLFVITKKSAEPVAPIAAGEPAPNPTASRLESTDLPPEPEKVPIVDKQITIPTPYLTTYDPVTGKPYYSGGSPGGYTITKDRILQEPYSI